MTIRIVFRTVTWIVSSFALFLTPATLSGQVVIKGERVYTMAGPALEDAVVVIRDGKISAVGPAAETPIPQGFRMLEAAVVTPGLVDAHTVVGLSGYLNQPHDQDQLERSSPIQPELRAIDAYDAKERLVQWVSEHGVTTIHSGHGPGALISGQTLIAKTTGRNVDEAVIVPEAMMAATLGDGARAAQGKSPGSRSKMLAMMRSAFLQAQEYGEKQTNAEEGKKPPVDLRKAALWRVLQGQTPLLITVHRVPDILSAIRLAQEFKIRLVLDGVAEAHLVLDEIRKSGYPVILHPPMMRHFGEAANATFEASSLLRKAGIPFALQSGFEGYVPKTRILPFEAAIAVQNGLSVEEALSSITIDAARIIGVDGRVGSLEPGKDGDVALFDGDPFEYTSHCIGVVIEGRVVSEVVR